MTLPLLDDLQRDRFIWPEPYVIELLAEHYAPYLGDGAKRSLSRQHQHVLRTIIEDTRANAAQLRARLGDSAQAMGLDRRVLADVEAAVFFELMRLVGDRFRNSPRLRDAYADRLRRALEGTPSAQTPARGRSVRFARPVFAA